jgi:hypothetical protein
LPLRGGQQEVRGRSEITRRVTCIRCGTYDVGQTWLAVDRSASALDNRQRVRLSHHIRKATDAHGRFTETLNDVTHLSFDRMALPNALEQIDILLSSIASRTELGLATKPEHFETWLARLGLSNVLQLEAIQTELARLFSTTLDSANSTVSFRLTYEGWQRAEAIRRRQGPGNQAFVAMWFHAGLLSAFREGIQPALVETGYKPYRIDFEAHESAIDDEIIAALRRSKLVIVDATGGRPNAYFEAGFAMGLGVPVIWCCNGSWRGYSVDLSPDNPTLPSLALRPWTELLAFDTRQQPFVVWTDPGDLRLKLRDRIRALGFDAQWNAST